MAQAVDIRARGRLQDRLHPETLVPGLAAGVFMGCTEVMFALSFGSLIFSGELAPYLPQGIGMALITATVILISTSLASAVPGVIGSTASRSAAGAFFTADTGTRPRSPPRGAGSGSSE